MSSETRSRGSSHISFLASCSSIGYLQDLEALLISFSVTREIAATGDTVTFTFELFVFLLHGIKRNPVVHLPFLLPVQSVWKSSVDVKMKDEPKCCSLLTELVGLPG